MAPRKSQAKLQKDVNNTAAGQDLNGIGERTSCNPLSGFTLNAEEIATLIAAQLAERGILLCRVVPDDPTLHTPARPPSEEHRPATENKNDPKNSLGKLRLDLTSRLEETIQNRRITRSVSLLRNSRTLKTIEKSTKSTVNSRRKTLRNANEGTQEIAQPFCSKCSGSWKLKKTLAENYTFQRFDYYKNTPKPQDSKKKR